MSPTRYVTVESVSTAMCGKTVLETVAGFVEWRAWLSCGRRDSNPHSEELVPKTSASANSATPASSSTLCVPTGGSQSRTVD